MAGIANLNRRLREVAVSFGSKTKGDYHGVGEVDFRQALREADVPLTESDIRRVFAHFEVRLLGTFDSCSQSFMNRIKKNFEILFITAYIGQKGVPSVLLTLFLKSLVR